MPVVTDKRVAQREESGLADHIQFDEANANDLRLRRKKDLQIVRDGFGTGTLDPWSREQDMRLVSQ